MQTRESICVGSSGCSVVSEGRNALLLFKKLGVYFGLKETKQAFLQALFNGSHGKIKEDGQHFIFQTGLKLLQGIRCIFAGKNGFQEAFVIASGARYKIIDQCASGFNVLLNFFKVEDLLGFRCVVCFPNLSEATLFVINYKKKFYFFLQRFDGAREGVFLGNFIKSQLRLRGLGQFFV